MPDGTSVVYRYCFSNSHNLYCDCEVKIFFVRVRVRMRMRMCVCVSRSNVCINSSCLTYMEFSGDTMPCEALEVLGCSAELVIHEANFEDSMLDLAKKKKHSTTRRVPARLPVCVAFTPEQWCH